MKYRVHLMRLAGLAGVAAACTVSMADEKSRLTAPVLTDSPDGTLLVVPATETVVGGSPIGDEPVFGDRGNACAGAACQGSVDTFAGATTFRRSDLTVLTTGGQQQTWRAAENFSVTQDGQINQLCVMGIYITPANGVAATPVGATWRVRYYKDAGGFPCLIPIAEFTIGAAAPTAGTSFTIETAVGGGPFNRYTYTHPPVDVLRGECLWFEVVDVQPLTTPFFAMLTQTPVTNGDDRVASIAVVGANSAVTYGPASILPAANNLHFCVNVVGTVVPGTSLDTTSDCAAVSINPPPNDEVGAAIELTIGDPAVGGTTVNAQQDFIRPCGLTVGNAGGVWYRVVGNGNTLTVDVTTSDCADPQIAVYDATIFDGGMGGTDESLICVGDDDDSGEGAGASLSFCSGDGTSYLIFVRPADQTFNNNFGTGPFTIAVSNGASCDTPDGGNCDVVGAEMGDILESEACGVDSNANCSGALTNPAEPYAIGTTVFGTHTTVFGASRNFDSYSFQVAGVSRELVFTYQASAPILVQFVTCSGTGTATLFDGLVLLLPACEEGASLQAVFSPNNYAVQFIPIGFGGYDGCAADFINYRFSLVDAVQGACCVGDQCSLNTEIACFDANGVFQGEATTCDVGSCVASCDLTLAGTDTAETETCRGIALSQTVPSLNGTCATAQALNSEGDTIFGNLSTDVEGVPNGIAIRDIDHYSFTLLEETDVTLTLTAEADAEFGVVACPAGTFVTDVFTADSCVEASQTVTLPAGTFAVQVRSAEFTGLPCTSNQNDYRLGVSFGGEECPADFNGSGAVDLNDLLDYVEAWTPAAGTSVPPNTPVDFNGSLAVDLNDLLDFVEAWTPAAGTTCP